MHSGFTEHLYEVSRRSFKLHVCFFGTEISSPIEFVNKHCFFLLPPKPETHGALFSAEWLWPPNGLETRRIGLNVIQKLEESCRMGSFESPNWLISPPNGLESRRMGSPRMGLKVFQKWARLTRRMGSIPPNGLETHRMGLDRILLFFILAFLPQPYAK